MKKLLLHSMCVGGLAALSMMNSAFAASYSEVTDVQAVADNKIYIYADLSRQDEMDAVMGGLEQGGLVGQFVISAADMQAYPEYVASISARGHLVIIKPSDAVPASTRLAAAKPQAKSDSVAWERPQSRNTNSGGSARAVTPREVLAPQSGNANTKPGSVAWERPQKGNYTDSQMHERQSARTQKMSKKQYIERDFMRPGTVNGKADVKRPTALKASDDVPDWSLVSIGKLSDYGLLTPDDVIRILSEPSRELMAQMTTRAYHNYGLYEDELTDEVAHDADTQLHRLFDEYDNELRNLGYDAGNYTAYDQKKANKNLRIGGEIRYNYVDHSGTSRVSHSYDDGYSNYNDFDSRVRTRLYLDKSFDGNWAIHGMVESDKSWYHDDKDGKPDFKRIYIDGEYKDIFWTFGRFATLWGDGNIYDGEFTGVRAQTGDKVRYTAEAGKLRDDEKVIAIKADYEQPEYDLSAGLHRVTDAKTYNPRYRGRDLMVASLGAMRYFGNFGVGAMILASDKKDVNDDQLGYVLTAKYGRNRSWVPGTYELFAHYYDQPDTTYIGHTMVGLADRMEGFKGYNFGLYYTIAENVVYSFEYYDLKNKYNDAEARTIWNHVSFYF